MVVNGMINLKSREGVVNILPAPDQPSILQHILYTNTFCHSFGPFGAPRWSPSSFLILMKYSVLRPSFLIALLNFELLQKLFSLLIIA